MTSSSSSGAGGTASGEWTRGLEAVTTNIQNRTRKQQRLLDRTQASGDCARAKTLIKSYISENSHDVATAKTLIKSLNEECSKNKSAMLVRTTRALGHSFQLAIEESSEVENRLMQRVKQLESEGATRRENIIYAKYDEENNGKPSPAGFTSIDMRGGGGDGDDDGQELGNMTQLQQEQQKSTSLTAELFEAAFHERNQEIGFLLEGVQEINAMMQDLNQMVVDQGEKLDEIEDNTLSAHQSAVKSAENLRKAAGHQKGDSKMWMLTAAVIFILLLLIGGFVASKL
jgi:hypothetical protein